MIQKIKTRRAFTMVELLIVVAIAMLLVAIAIPFIRPGIETSRLREATRQVNTFIVGAKARAAESGRPFGVRLIRSSVDETGDPNDCYRMQYVEVPPYYSGDVDGARISVGGPIPAPSATEFYASVPHPLVDASSGLLSSVPDEVVPKNLRFVAPGDLIRFNYAGVWYRIDDIDRGQGHTGANDTVLRLSILPNPTINTYVVNPGAPLPNRPFSAVQKLPYQISRKPQLAGTATIELPSNVSIDLAMSGISTSGSQEFAAGTNPANAADATYRDSTPVDIIFSPSGQVSNIAYQGGIQPINSSIYLLIARTENVVSGVGGTPPTAAAMSQNLNNNDHYWVAVQFPTGAVLTAENLGNGAPDVGLARDLVRSGVAKGSR